MKASHSTKEKAEAARAYIESNLLPACLPPVLSLLLTAFAIDRPMAEKYSKQKVEETQRKQNWDAIRDKLKEMKLDAIQTQQITDEIIQQEAEQLRRQ